MFDTHIQLIMDNIRFVRVRMVYKVNKVSPGRINIHRKSRQQDISEQHHFDNFLVSMADSRQDVILPPTK